MPTDKETKTQLPRSIPEAINQLSLLLANGAQEKDVAAAVLELNRDYTTVRETYVAAREAQKNAEGTMERIIRALSDPRIRELGIDPDIPTERSRPHA